MGNTLGRYTILLALFHNIFFLAGAQRVYQPHSILSQGSWYQLSVKEEGVYKLDLAFLNSLGISGPISSAQVRLFGRENTILPEAAGAVYTDDLGELAVEVVDGGDGMLNGADHILFYAKGVHQWRKDSVNRRFVHQKNPYSDEAYYYISIGGVGKRIALQNLPPSASVLSTSFDERFYYEPDSVNFLSSGKEWYGSELSNLPGRALSRSFSIPAANVIANSAYTLVTNAVARSMGNSSKITAFINSQFAQQLNMAAVGAGLYDRFAQPDEQVSTGVLNQSNIQLTYTYTPTSFNAQSWLNWFELFFRRTLTVGTEQLLFRDWNTVGNDAVEFRVANASSATKVWDVTNALEPVLMNASFFGNEIRFRNDAKQLHEYVAFAANFLSPKAIGKISNQDLHQTSEQDYFIITHPSFLMEAQRLAAFHQQKNKLKAVVVTTDKIYHEFSAGIADPAAIRDFVKMYYDRYRSTWNAEKKFLCLFGKGSFDYKSRIANNTNYVPAYESSSSLDPLSTYTSDDFFGFLDDNEDINSGLIVNLLDIGVGRIPVRNSAEAKAFVDKAVAYYDTASHGPWRNNINFIADDEDANMHVRDAESVVATVKEVAPLFNNYKIYLDAYRQEGGAAGGRYPEVNTLINNHIEKGTLIWNYNGHGGAQRLAEEVILDQQAVNSWSNGYRLPLMVTATCDFGPYDQPGIFSLGENLLLRPKNGAIALMTTTRVVFAFSNRILNDNYMRFALGKDASGRYRTLGAANLATKNYTYQTSGDVINNRKFALLGDPAMTLGFPQNTIQLTRVNGNDILQVADTLSATELAVIDGEVRDSNQQILGDFNGTVFLSLFDKPQTVTTLGNDATSTPFAFQQETSVLFSGKVSATAGKFSFRFRMPKDINYRFDSGKLSVYAQGGVGDATGFTRNIIIGGQGNNFNTDKEGPQIKAYLNDDRFVNGSITNEAPLLLLKLSDSSGINTGNAGIDHDLIATLDGDNRQYFLLNDFYESALNSYQIGEVRFQLPKLKPGPHSLQIKAWDVLNNSSVYELNFIVANDEELRLEHVLNYPNPFSTKTQFWFEHNKPGMEIYVTVEVMSITGKIIKRIQRAINTAGNRSNEVEWDGRDEYGDRVGRGVYLYRLTVRSADGKKGSKLQRLVLIQ